MIINKNPLVRKSFGLDDTNLHGVNSLWQDEEFLLNMSKQTFRDYPIVRLVQTLTIAEGVVLAYLGNMMIQSPETIYTVSFVVTGLAMTSALSLIILSDKYEENAQNYIFKLEAKDRLKKLARKKKLVMSSTKHQEQVLDR